MINPENTYLVRFMNNVSYNRPYSQPNWQKQTLFIMWHRLPYVFLLFTTVARAGDKYKYHTDCFMHFTSYLVS
jgi:hypothetical protein